MKHLKLFEDYYSDNPLYRNTAQEWLEEFLREGKKIAEEGRFISFSLDEESGGMDEFGKIRIMFDSKKLFDQEAIEVNYDPEFMERHPDISLYVTGYESMEDYIDNIRDEWERDNEKEMPENEQFWSWEGYVETEEHEQEVVMKEIKYEEDLIEKVIFFERPKPSLIKLLEEKNILWTENGKLDNL